MATQYNKRFRKIIYEFINIFILIIGFSIAYKCTFKTSFLHYDNYYSTFLKITLFIWLFCSFIFNSVDEHQGWKFIYHFRTLIKTYILFMLLEFIYLVGFKVTFFSRMFLSSFLMITFFLLVITYFLRYQLLRWIRSKGRNFKSVLVIGKLPTGYNNENWNILKPEWGYRIEDVIDVDVESKDYILLLGEYLSKKKYDEILITNPSHLGENIEAIIDLSENNGLRIKIVPKFFNNYGNRVKIDYLNGTPVMNVRYEPLSYFHNRIIKRFFDLFVSIIFIITIYWWVHILIGIAIKLTSKGPVLFTQKRIGVDNKTFKIYKFRTMAQNKDINNAREGIGQITKVGDSRITKVGEFLRKTNLDELPQFLNVLLGCMSIVGPRPLMIQEDREVQKKIKKYRIRQFIKPGLTGWAQINGYRGGTENMKLMSKRIQHDIYYIERWNSLFDLKIIWKTAWQMITMNTQAH